MQGCRDVGGRELGIQGCRDAGIQGCRDVLNRSSGPRSQTLRGALGVVTSHRAPFGARAWRADWAGGRRTSETCPH